MFKLNESTDNNTGILLISDLHITDPLYGRGVITSKFDDTNSFYNVFEQAVLDNSENAENEKRMKLKYIIVAGDVSDIALGSEFEKATVILEGLCDTFSVNKENVLIIPGNHDIDREEYRRFCYKEKIAIEKFTDYQKEKFVSFKDFYDHFYCNPNIIFDPSKAITRFIHINECDVVIIGVNTLFKDSFRQDHHYGYINAAALDTELKQLRLKYKNQKMIAVMHHSPETSSPNLINSIKNWNQVSPLFQRYNVNSFIAGHAHTNDGVTAVTKKTRDYLTCGSLSASEENVRSSFMLLKYTKDKMNEKLQILPFHYEEDYNTAYWQPQTEQPNMIKHIIIK